MDNSVTLDLAESIAIVGLTGRFPGAKNINEFWQNLKNGMESITFFSDEELDPTVQNSANYVKAGSVLEDIELFDASFFGFNPKEAEVMDPQHRLFLECAWDAIENAGYSPERYNGQIGVYAGVSISTYLLFNLLENRKAYESATSFQTMALQGNDKDYLATRVSYKLNLKGPSVTVQTACSTSLVAVHLACRSLLNYQCDMALAGGVSVRVPQRAGYFFEDGGILSPDGHCRAFDAKAQGTIFGSGVGIVVLKRLEDALADGDCIHALINGSAINNDGSLKAGYTAPSVDGQAEVIAEALAMAEVEPETMTYIEAHGTGTSLGDPIELAALTQVFHASTNKKGFCAIGSVKTNVGHLNAAAGVTGLIKTVLALEHQMIPASLHFSEANPRIDFVNSPFYVNTTLSEWKTDGLPRRAGVSSFGMGGTNAHVVLSEAATIEASGESRPRHLLLLSAKTSSALETMSANLGEYLQQHPDLNLADVAYTLQVGRVGFKYRRMLVCHDIDDAVIALETLDPERILTRFENPKHRPVVFMFPGQGAQYVNMASELYEVEATFREQVDLCSELLKPHLGFDLRQLLYPPKEQAEEARTQLGQTFITQPALFVIEYALAKLWMEWGVHPQMMIGHSIGEYVAACLAGVLELSDALAVVAIRGRLMQNLPGGAMLAVPLPALEVQSFLSQELSLAAINGPSLCVVSGPVNAVDALQNRLTKQGVECRRLHTSHAFHSATMEPILGAFTEQIKKIKLKPPQIPYLSNVTGTWIKATEATDPSYWAKHLRQTVLFVDGMNELLKEPNAILLEVGPGRTLSTLTRRLKLTAEQVVLSSLRHPRDQQSDVAFLLNRLGQLWLAGVEVDWSGFYLNEQRHRLPLPTYPFERQRYWIEAAKVDANTVRAIHKKSDMAKWLYIPSWKRSMLPKQRELAEPNSCWLVFADRYGVGEQIVKQLEQKGIYRVITVVMGKQFTRLANRVYTINPQQPDDYDTLFDELRALNKSPKVIIHLWSVTPNDYTPSEVDFFDKSQNLGFYTLLFLVQALGKQNLTSSIQIDVVSSQTQDVTGQEVLYPEKAAILAPCKVIPQEYPNITCRGIDVVVPKSGSLQEKKLIGQLTAELTAQPSEMVVAYRGNHRWVQTFEPVLLNGIVEGATQLRQGGVYLITGGLAGIGFVLAKHLAKTVQAKLILTKRSAFPENERGRVTSAHDITHQIEKVQALEELGAEVLVVSADVANLEQMQEVITRADERFGGLHGVIHAEEVVTGLVNAIDNTDRTECEWHLRAKIRGLFVLEKVLQGRELDFCILQSSLSAVLGGLELLANAAASLLMDAFVHKHNRANRVPWISVNWDRWQLRKEEEQNSAPYATWAELAITPTEGVEAFQNILSLSAINQVVVSTGDLQTRLDQWVKRESLQVQAQKVSSASLHPRPNLPNAYVAPRDELEQTIVDTWIELLGIDQVGIHDNFFELGGHSLLATQLVSRLREIFPVELGLRRLFEAHTVAKLAEVLDKILLEKIEELSEEEVLRLA